MGASEALLENSGDSGDAQVGQTRVYARSSTARCPQAGGKEIHILDVTCTEQLLVWPQQRMDPHCWRRVGRAGRDSPSCQ